MIVLTGDIHENAFLPPAGETKMFEVVSSGAFVTKYYYTGERENFGILEYSPASTDIKLFDKRAARKAQRHRQRHLRAQGDPVKAPGGASRHPCGSHLPHTVLHCVR